MATNRSGADWTRVREIFEAALARGVEERAAFVASSCRDEPAIAEQVLALLAAHAHADDFLETPAVNALGHISGAAAAEPRIDPNIGRAVGPYIIESSIGEGGMGAVYLARRADEAFERRVAIKMIRQGLDSGEVIRKFHHERQILASLNHPFIARLYDGGTTTDGVPYLVMEFVDGVPVDAYCDRRGLPLADRLRLFRQVCEAVQYAHQRLVIHRDLKPSNILVQSDGVPKLLDFGIAKLLDAPVGADTTLLRPMTPAFASPEQIRGDAITTASDVYSLGVILYRLLTDVSPYPGDPRSTFELARAVCEREPVRPSHAVPDKLRRQLAGDLDNIVLKALRKEPEHRYASVEQFSADVQCHLQGLPVAASHGTWTYRGAKFISRHKLGVAAAAVVLLAIIGGAVATAWQARAARRQAAIAQTERARAEQRLADVRKLSNAMIFELHDSIADLPGATAARKLIVERALQYLDILAGESRHDPTLQRELADGYKRIGDLQGGPYTANVGDTPMALASYQRSLSIRQALLDAGPVELKDQIGFAEISRLIADALKAGGDPSAALTHTQAAMRILEDARASHAGDQALLEELMRTYGAAASLYASSLVTTSFGDLAAALPLRHKQLEIAEQLSAMNPSDQDRLKTLASALSAMGDQLLMTGQRREAASHFGRAQQLLVKLNTGSTSRSSLFALHDNYYRLLFVQLAEGDLHGADATARRAIAIVDSLVRADAEDAQARVVLAADIANAGEVMALMGRHEEAKAAISRAIAIDAELIRRYPNSSQYRRIRYHRLLAGGRSAELRRDYTAALHFYRDAEAILLDVIKQDPKNQGSRLRLGVAYNGMGSSLLGLQQIDAAAAAYQKGIDVLSDAIASGTLDEDVIYSGAESFAGMGRVAEAQGAAAGNAATRLSHLRTSMMWTDRSLELWKRVKEPGLTSPAGYPCTPLPEVRAQRERVRAALS